MKEESDCRNQLRQVGCLRTNSRRTVSAAKRRGFHYEGKRWVRTAYLSANASDPNGNRVVLVLAERYGRIRLEGSFAYHGRPDAPTIGTLGCAITPDADDTALVWRIAPGAHPELLPIALATLDRYRTSEALYRTWLAPRDRYQCIDPGKDPDPSDVVIQMHVLMLLAQVDPPAAHALWRARARYQ